MALDSQDDVFLDETSRPLNLRASSLRSYPNRIKEKNESEEREREREREKEREKERERERKKTCRRRESFYWRRGEGSP